MDAKVLEEIGLTPGEVRAYLALLELGESSTGPIAKASQVSRSKLYIILDKLEKKGLVSHVEKDGTVHFQAAEPSKINDYLQDKEEKLKNLKKNFNEFLPQLNALHGQLGRVQKVSIYQGLKGLQTSHEHTYLKLKRGESYASIGISAFQPEAQHNFWKKDHLRRSNEGIKCQLLFEKGTSRKILENRNSYKGCEARYMPFDIKTPAYYMVYKDIVMIAIPSEDPIVIEITSQEVANSFMAYFQDFWKRSVPFK
jgi:DNA-binding MarR family transcriptional regulator